VLGWPVDRVAQEEGPRTGWMTASPLLTPLDPHWRAERYVVASRTTFHDAGGSVARMAPPLAVTRESAAGLMATFDLTPRYRPSRSLRLLSA
jgi:hypothetical protein